MLELSKTRTRDGSHIEVEAVNEGPIDTDEVVQVYVQNEGSAHAPRNPRLCDFARVRIPAGGFSEVAFDIPEERLLVVNDEGALVQEGIPVFYVGFGQPDARTAALTGKRALKL